MFKVIIGLFITTLSFGVIFNVRGTKLIYAAIVGICAGSVLYGLKSIGYNVYLSQFLAAMTLSGLSEIFARKIKTPVTTFMVCALIPLVPGGGMYLSMKALMESNLTLSNQILMDVLAQSGSIAFGFVVVATISAIYRVVYKK